MGCCTVASMRRLPVIALGLAVLPLAAQTTAKVEIDNQWVKVLRIRLEPHASTSFDMPLPAVGVVLGDLKEDGNLRKAGDVYFLPGKITQLDENPWDRPAEQILIELKPGAPKSPPVKLDPVRLDPQHHPVVLENDRVRAIRTILEPHLKSPMHEHPHYVVVYMTELHTTMTLSDGRKVDNPRRPGDVAWRDALSHVTENIGERTAVEIQVEIK
jgi:quercetin dioxygenase-like cupin family protein